MVYIPNYSARFLCHPLKEIRHNLETPEFGDGDGEKLQVSVQWQNGRTIIKHDPTLEIVASLFGQSPEPFGVGWIDAGGGFDLHTPSPLALCKHAIDFYLILVAVVPQSSFRLQPLGLDADLLDHE